MGRFVEGIFPPRDIQRALDLLRWAEMDVLEMRVYEDEELHAPAVLFKSSSGWPKNPKKIQNGPETRAFDAAEVQRLVQSGMLFYGPVQKHRKYKGLNPKPWIWKYSKDIKISQKGLEFLRINGEGWEKLPTLVEVWTNIPNCSIREYPYKNGYKWRRKFHFGHYAWPITKKEKK